MDVLQEAKQLLDGELDAAVSDTLALWQEHLDNHSLTREKARKPRRSTIIIPEGEKYDVMAERQRIFDALSDQLSEQLYTGELSIGQWQEQMKLAIREFHTAATVIASGGWDNVSSRDYGRIGPVLREQYKYLHRFAQHIAENKDNITLAYLKARSRLYGEGAVKTGVLIETPVYIYDMLPWIPKDGSTPCLNGCHCKWVSRVVSVDGNWQTVEFTWHLGEAEHCGPCVGRDGHVEVLRIPLDVDVPIAIGGY